MDTSHWLELRWVLYTMTADLAWICACTARGAPIVRCMLTQNAALVQLQLATVTSSPSNSASSTFLNCVSTARLMQQGCAVHPVLRSASAGRRACSWQCCPPRQPTPAPGAASPSTLRPGASSAAQQRLPCDLRPLNLEARDSAAGDRFATYAQAPCCLPLRGRCASCEAHHYMASRLGCANSAARVETTAQPVQCQVNSQHLHN